MKNLIILSIALIALFAVTFYMTQEGSSVSESHTHYKHYFTNYKRKVSFCVEYQKIRFVNQDYGSCIRRVTAVARPRSVRVCYHRYFRRAFSNRGRWYKGCYNVKITKWSW